MFGVRDGWLNVPKQLRHPQLSSYISFRMVDAEQRKKHSSHNAVSAPPRPTPLREMFTPASTGWSDRQRQAAIELAKQCNWNDCFQKYITVVGANEPQNIHPVKDYNTEVKEDDFLVHLRKLSIEHTEHKSSAFGQALGGVLLMLYHCAHQSELGLAVFRLVAGIMSDKDSAQINSNSILTKLPHWVKGGKVSEQADNSASLFWGVVECLVVAQKQEPSQEPRDEVIKYLKDQVPNLPKDKVSTMENWIKGIPDHQDSDDITIEDQLKKHKESLLRPLRLFVFTKQCNNLLKFKNLLKPEEYILAAILFGVCDTQLPEEFLTEHRQSADTRHHKQAKTAALELAKEYHWNDCLQTRVTLDDGSQKVIEGEVQKSGEKEVPDFTDKFLQHLGQWPPIDPKIESDLRRQFEVMIAKSE